MLEALDKMSSRTASKVMSWDYAITTLHLLHQHYTNAFMFYPLVTFPQSQHRIPFPPSHSTYTLHLCYHTTQLFYLHRALAWHSTENGKRRGRRMKKITNCKTLEASGLASFQETLLAWYGQQLITSTDRKTWATRHGLDG